MKIDKRYSWKKKIDPAFDDLIKVYLDYIKLTHICNLVKDTKYKKYTRYKRYLFLDDVKVLERKGYPPLLREFKSNLRNLKKLTNDAIACGASPDIMFISECIEYMLKLFNKNDEKKSKRRNKISDTLKSKIMSMIRILPREDSGNYYKNRLQIYLLPKEAKAFVEGKTQNDLQKVISEILNDTFCLMFQVGISGYWDSQTESYNITKANKSDLIAVAMQQVYDSISILTYKKSLVELYEEAQNNDESLCNAIHLDKTLFEEDWVRKRIRKAFYSGDSDFLKKLGRAIAKPPIPAKIEHGELLLTLVKFWPMGLCRLEIKELMGLLKSSRVPMQDDIENFGTYIKRLKRSNVLFDVDKLITIKKNQT